MNRKELLEYIDEGIRSEESASSIYLQHLNAVVVRSTVSKEDMVRMKKLIDHLIKENQRHKSLLESVRKKVQGEQDDVF